MKTTTVAFWSSIEDFLTGKPADVSDAREYSGDVALADRALQKTAQNAANAATDTSKKYGAGASELSPTITGVATGMATNPQGFGSDLSGMIGSQEQIAGANTGDVEQQARLRAARTGNAGGLAAADVAGAGAATRADGQNVQDVYNQNELLKEQQREFGADTLRGMYGTDVGAQLTSAGQIPADVNAGVNAGNSGWFQNTMNAIRTIGGLKGR